MSPGGRGPGARFDDGLDATNHPHSGGAAPTHQPPTSAADWPLKLQQIYTSDTSQHSAGLVRIPSGPRMHGCRTGTCTVRQPYGGRRLCVSSIAGAEACSMHHVCLGHRNSTSGDQYTDRIAVLCGPQGTGELAEGSAGGLGGWGYS